MGIGLMNAIAQFDEAFARCPLIAILRGVRPDEVETIGDALVETGITIIEVPLNSPQSLASIERLARLLEGRAMVGAGTVLKSEEVGAVASAGGRLIISPNTDVRVIAAAVEYELAAVPGFFSPTEALAALAAGASALKLFPAEGANPRMLRAVRAVLPADTRILPVGGINPSVLNDWQSSGAAGFGLGSALYKPGMLASDVAANARAFVKAWNAAQPGDEGRTKT
jgi:2-dehydro-3-deoxyphosphogalactonate aldolase